MADKDPSRSTQYRMKRDAKAFGEQDSDDLTSDTSSGSDGESDEGQRQNQRTWAKGNLNESAREDQSGSDNDNEEAEGNASGAEEGQDEGEGEGPDPVHGEYEEPGDEMEVEGEKENSDDADDEGEDDDEGDDGDESEDGDGDTIEDEEEGGDQPEGEVPNDEDEELLNVGGAASSESSASDSENDESAEESDRSSEEEEQEDGEAHEAAANGDVPLYPNARISLIESLLMILTLSLRFSLSGECIAHILELIEMHCPAGNFCKKSLFTFKSFFVEIGRKSLVLHYYCEFCMAELESKDSVCVRCGDQTKMAFFIEIPLIQQLQRLFLRPGFVEQLMYRFNRVKKHKGNYEDIYDGAVYKEQVENGFLSHFHNISLMWYTDGIQIFKSTKFAVWPLFFSINELSYKARTLKENTLLCGLWFGKSKPKPNLFLKPFRETFQTFKTDGFRFHVPEGEPITVKCKLLCGTCDLQAKSLFLRSKLYNGYYGCTKCYSKGQRAPAGRTTVHVHPFTPAENVRIRKNKDVLQCARLARRTLKSHVLGIKGLSMLYFLMPDMIRGTGIDLMHQLFLGVCKTVTKFWFDSKFSGELFSCSAMTDTINERLSSMRPPSFVQRMTRSLTELKLWKAKEYKLFFFVYAIPVLNGLLPNEFLFHHLKLVSAISLLCQESIFPEQVDRAEILLNEYVQEFQQLYGLRYMSMNVHLLTHLAQCVRELGPLWVCSCFFFLEDLNGQLVKLIHGPYQPGIQIMSSASLFMSLNVQMERLHPNSVAKQFCLRLREFGSKFTVAEQIDQKSCVVGNKAFRRNVSLELIDMIQEQQHVENGNFLSFFTLRKKGVFYDSADKPDSRNRCSKYVKCQNDGVPIIGQIVRFVRWSQCECRRVCTCLPAVFFCVVKVYERTQWIGHQVPRVSIFHQFAVTPTDELKVLRCEQIESSCFYVNVDDCVYLTTPVNSLEYE